MKWIHRNRIHPLDNYLFSIHNLSFQFRILVRMGFCLRPFLTFTFCLLFTPIWLISSISRSGCHQSDDRMLCWNSIDSITGATANDFIVIHSWPHDIAEGAIAHVVRGTNVYLSNKTHIWFAKGARKNAYPTVERRKLRLGIRNPWKSICMFLWQTQ